MDEKKNVVKRDETGLVMIGEKVWDAEAQKHVLITAEMVARYVTLRNQYVMTEAMRCDIMFQVRATRYFLVEGCPTFADWCEKFARMTARTGRRMAERGERMFLLINHAQAAGLPGEKIEKALKEGPAKTRQLLLEMPLDEAVEQLEKTWIAPDGQERTPEEAVKILGKDLHDKLKGAQDALRIEKERRETLEAEVDALRKRMSGDTTVAQDLAAQLEIKQQELEQLRGKRERGEAAAVMLKKAEQALELGFGYLRPYMPDKDSDLDEMPEEIAMAVGLVSRFRMRLDNLFQTYIVLDMKRNQP